MRKLYIFPVRFPYTDVAECFLAQELPFLKKQFDHIVVVPLKKEVSDAKSLPDNCKIVGPIFGNTLLFILKGFYCSRTFTMLWKDFFKKRVWRDLKKIKIWIIGYITINNILNSRKIKEIERSLNRNDICYFYWGKWSNILSYFWHGKVTCVSRFHGWGDLWEYDYNNYFPLRNEVVGSLDYAIHISSVGEKYFSQKYPQCKTKIFRLGSFDNGLGPNSDDTVINIISCSSLWPLKRVDLILESVCELAKNINRRICYTHIGGAPSEVCAMNELAEKNSVENLKIKFLGSISHDQVLMFYKTNPCDVFINLSRSEGVPVSIMEAISFGIPTVATNVGGTSDVVSNGVSGELVSENPSVKEVVNALLKIIKNKSNYQPRSFWAENFNADKNYTSFSDFLYQL